MKDEIPTITLADARDIYNFRLGMPVGLSMTPGGEKRVLTQWERIVASVKQRLLRMTRWFRPRTVISRVDIARGIVTIGTERWSWRRWRWERQ